MDGLKNILGAILGVVFGILISEYCYDLYRTHILKQTPAKYQSITEDDVLQIQVMPVIQKYYPDEYETILTSFKDSVQDGAIDKAALLKIGIKIDTLAAENLIFTSDEALLKYWGIMRTHMLNLLNLSPECCVQMMDGTPECLSQYTIVYSDSNYNLKVLTEVIVSAKESPVQTFNEKQALADMETIFEELIHKHTDVYQSTEELTYTKGNEKEVCQFYLDLADKINDFPTERAANVIRLLISFE